MSDNEFPSTLASSSLYGEDLPYTDSRYYNPRETVRIGGSMIKTVKPEPQDLVNHPPHYGSHPSGVECIQITEHMNFLLGNAVKYIWRSGDKGTEEADLRKARWYIGRELMRKGYCTQEQFEAICELDKQEQS